MGLSTVVDVVVVSTTLVEVVVESSKLVEVVVEPSSSVVVEKRATRLPELVELLSPAPGVSSTPTPASPAHSAGR